ncbi:hypothetical protein [Dyadobacter crusticola]|uniref:hypothetical protein n=1 Tax=Dyadobacter crusticola TaxID=292407 RepID=UPI0004E1DEFE|nr:hypothetical protein [Dyadobacter crusticola]
MKLTLLHLLILLATVSASTLGYSQSRDPIKFTLATSVTAVNLDEDFEIVIRAQRLDFPAQTAFIFKDLYSFRIKVILPSGFVHTGGTYLENIGTTLSSSQPEVSYTIRGRFTEISDANRFTLLRTINGIAGTDRFVAVASLAFATSEPDQGALSKSKQSAMLQLNNFGLVPYTTVEGLRSGLTGGTDVAMVVNNDRVYTFRRDTLSTAPDNGATVVSDSSYRYHIDSDHITPEMFGAKGNGIDNDLSAFQNALEVLNAAGGGKLVLAAKSYVLNNDYSNKLNGVLKIKTPIEIVGSHGTTIRYNYGQAPLFHFQNASHIRVEGIDFAYTGSQPTVFPNSYTAFLSYMGIAKYWAGSSSEMCVTLNLLGCDNYSLNNLRFYSETKDNNHCIGYAIILKGKDGMIDPAVGGRLKNISFSEFQMGVYMSLQSQFVIDGLHANFRGSSANIPPGHVVYVVDAVDGTRDTYSEDGLIQNITEGPNVYAADLGTLSLKGMKRCVITNVFSQHPGGLIQSIQKAQDCIYENLSWSNYENIARNPIINLSSTSRKERLLFRNISLDSGPTFVRAIEFTQAAAADVTSIRFDDILIRSLPYTDSGPRDEILHGRASGEIVMTNIRYYPTGFDASKTTCLILRMEPGSSDIQLNADIFGPYARSPINEISGPIERREILINSIPIYNQYNRPSITPKIGQLAYQTDGDEGYYINRSAGWTKVVTRAEGDSRYTRYLVDLSNLVQTKASLNATYGAEPAGTTIYFPNQTGGAMDYRKKTSSSTSDWEISKPELVGP